MKNYVILKTYCEKIFLVGSGNFWYEENEIGNDNSWYYKIFRGTLFSLYGFMTILEIMAVIFGNFPEDEKRDCVTFAVSHTIVMIKIFSVVSNKELIRTMNRNMVNICEPYEEPKLMADKYRIVKLNVMAYFCVVYGSAVCFVLEGLRKLFDGSHFVTVVTYYPTFEDNSICATGFRILTTVMLMLMMMTMIVSVDSFTMAYLIMLKYKFITLRHYLEGITEDFHKMNNSGNSRLAAERLTNGLVEGIVMHKDLLRMAKDIDQAFGTVIALQLCLSSGSAVSLLLQFALSDQLTFVAGMKIIFFVVALFFLLGLFLCNAGEITYQASLLADTIFYCGWHACVPQPPPLRNLRRLVLLACAQAQRPLIMKAFKMIQLSYSTFLQVLRGTYSVFALFYAQHK
uniref:Odorant receptor n=1 Tax=Conogethes pinicolalis TaxID=1178461 RepID=A0A5B9GGD4_9NEOP|nr:odorant receptor 39 [Conogethes pinicolalis]